MMKLQAASARWLLITWFALSVVFTLRGGWRWGRAEAEHARFATQTRETARQAQRVTDLRVREQWVALGERPTEDVIAAVRQVLRTVGIRDAALSDLRPESDAPVPTRSASPTPLRVQTIAFTLRSLSSGDLGAFLVGWREQHPVWTISRVTLTPSAPSSRDRAATSLDGRTGLFDVVLSMSAIYAEGRDP